ncbi:histidine kinase [Nitrosomonas sp. Nm166]|uniref:histidine kinase n=1 Tax=Nitrosomonas sp. Nm166 TaxID=1881054 RepID=UPI0008F41BBC|nr:histidine kinase [Nitrosomonas sp. Nm166]SFE15500.1 two-component system, NarL family, nitrate/nitrite sensor histidine kinase NarX/two-component system, NarL family, sensor histidine kinase UhpB [Nitrosomonas sp. Nm166]
MNQFSDQRSNKYRRFDDNEVRSRMELLSDQLQTQQLELEESRNRYADLYDHAPVGYLTVDKAGNILSINLTGAALLRKARPFLIGKPFIACFMDIDHEAFLNYLKEVFNSSGKTTIDLKIGDNHDPLSFIRLESTVTSDKNMCRMMMSDISQLKRMINLNRNLLNENRKLMKELFHIQEKERRILARELHDELGQWLTAIRAENEVILNYTEKDLPILTSVEAIKECIEKMHLVIRNMLHRLRPLLLDTLGLPDALLELKKQWCSNYPHIAFELKLEGELSMLNEQLNITIFRLIQEGLNNICKHSEATQAQVSLGRETIRNSAIEFLLLKIEDNGKGYDINQQFMGLGLVGIRERVIAMDGSMAVRSAPNEGVEINIRLPIKPKR